MGVPSIPWGEWMLIICLGHETMTQHCRVFDTDALDIVIGTDFLRRNPQGRNSVSPVPLLSALRL